MNLPQVKTEPFYGLHPTLHVQAQIMAAVSSPGNSANPPFPPHLNPLFRAAESQPDDRDAKPLSAYANLGIARYFMHHGEILTVSSPVALHQTAGYSASHASFAHICSVLYAHSTVL